MKRAFGILALAVVACGPIEDPTLHPAYDPATAAIPPTKQRTQRSSERSVFFGDLHIHTGLSTDAFIFGVRKLPDDAYRFAQGGAIEHAAGYEIRLSRPLDFAAVTDHSEFLGAARVTYTDLPLQRKSLRDRLLEDGPISLTMMFFESVRALTSDQPQPHGGAEETAKDTWRGIIDSAERNYQPGIFTTFVGYEWTSFVDDSNLHRCVIYRGTAVPELPFSAADSPNPEDLWRVLSEQNTNGMPVIAIPHNGNLSDGRMYEAVTFAGEPLTSEYARIRNEMEPVSEIFQVKGSSETHPLLSGEDDFAGFEIYDTTLSVSGAASAPAGSYARDALRTGLELSRSRGFNPYRFGMIGSSDGHNASSPVDEDRYHGKLPVLDGSAAIRLGEAYLLPKSQNRGGQWSAAGLAAVWAEENTRESIFDAMRRRETYATSGTWIRLRMFGGWELPTDLFERADGIALAYASGVPMGGSLAGRPADAQSPSLAVQALKDPMGANLDRIQIVKAWVDGAGASHERIYEVAASGGRRPDPATGKLAAVGSTVDVSKPSYDNSIGTAQLAVVWRDPDFDPEVAALYYARVIEIPTPRWSTYDAVALGIPPPEPTSLQERAVTSAIWYDASR